MHFERFDGEDCLVFDAVLSDQQWSLIKNESGLPDEARFPIGLAIDLYRSGKKALYLSRATDRRFSELKKHLSDTEEVLRGLVQDEDFFAVVASRSLVRDNAKEERERLEDFLTQIETHASSLDSTHRQFRRRPGRPSNGPVEELIFRLGSLYMGQTGKLINQSNQQRWVTIVCRIADPTISEFRITAAIKKFIREERDVGSVLDAHWGAAFFHTSEECVSETCESD